MGLLIHTDTVVTSIAYDENGVLVATENGDAFRAKYALVTIPLGVLKKGSVEFAPPLPKRKQEAIEHLGFGTLNKVGTLLLRHVHAFAKKMHPRPCFTHYIVLPSGIRGWRFGGCPWIVSVLSCLNSLCVDSLPGGRFLQRGFLVRPSQTGWVPSCHKNSAHLIQ
jgi:Flavin containing amine oxidoreductase